MTPDAVTYLAATLTCLVFGLVGLSAWVWRTERFAHVLWGVMGSSSAVLVFVAWVMRFSHAGHLPLFGTYESALSLALAVTVAAFVWEALGGFKLGVVPIASLIAAALLGHGLRFDSTVYALTISERSWVVDVHAFFAWAAFGVLAANAALAVREVVSRDSEVGAAGRMLPRTLQLGFLLHSAMMASGSFYKFLLFGKAWSFDPMETLGFIAWVSYGTLLHMFLFAGWRGRKLAAWCIFLFVLLVLSYRLIVYFPGWSSYHILDMNLRLHIVE
jgi:ABC-type uncharacterized transport system permease subunit